MIVALILPEMPTSTAKDPVGFMSNKSLQRPQPLPGHDVRRYQHVNVIGHDGEGMQFIAVKLVISIAQRFHHQPGNFGLAQMARACAGPIQYSIHCHECFPRNQSFRR